jgi:hypothetical protein
LYCVAHKAGIDNIPDVTEMREEFDARVKEFALELETQTDIFLKQTVSFLDRLLPVYRYQQSRLKGKSE